MASTVTSREHTGDGSDKTWAYSFQSFQKEDIKVAITDASGLFKNVTNFTIPDWSASSGTVTFNNTGVDSDVCESDGSPKASRIIRIFRETDITTGSVGEFEPKATYQVGSAVKASDLNNNSKQALYAAFELRDQEIQTSDIRDLAVTNAKLADGVVTNAKLGNNAVATAIITNDAVTTPKIINNAVTTTKLEDIAQNRITGRISSGTGDPEYLTGAQVRTIINVEDGATADQTASEIRTLVGSASDSNVFTDADHSKLDGIETGATGDQTNAEIRAAVEAASDSNVFTDADHTKLNGIENNATANQNAFSNVAVSGQNTVVADAVTDTLTLVGGNNVTLTTNTANDSVTIAAADNQNAFSNIAVSGQTTVAADTSTDTLTLVGGSNITVTTDASADSVTIAASGGEIFVQDEGNDLSTAATRLNFTGNGVVASGSGATKTITISGGGGSGSGITTDFQFLELKEHNNATGAFSTGAHDYELVTKGTSTVVTPSQAAALIISIGGVIQQPQPNQGDIGANSNGNDGFAIDGSSIHFGANLTEHPDFIIYLKGAGEVQALADNSVTTSKINDTNVTLAKLEHGTSSTNGKFLRSNNGADPTWEFVEGTAILSTGESGTSKFLCVDGDGTSSWQVPPNTQIGGATGADFSDNTKLRFGTGNDLEIYHNGTDSIIKDAGTGSLSLLGSAVFLQNAAQTDTCLSAVADGAVSLYYDNSKKLETYTDGIKVTNRIVGDGGDLRLSSGAANGDIQFQINGTTVMTVQDTSKLEVNDDFEIVLGNGSDLILKHNATDSSIINSTGDFLIQCTGDDLNLKAADDVNIKVQGGAENAIIAYGDGAVELYYDGSKKLETVSDGIDVAGSVDINSGGNLYLEDNGKIRIGTSEDLQIYHDGSHSYIKDAGTGQLRITSDSNIWIEHGNENMIVCNGDGSVELYYDNSKKFETTATGATISFSSDNSTVAEGLFLNNTAANNGDNVSIAFSTDSGNRKKSAISHVDTGSYGRGDIVFSVDPDADSGELDVVAHEKLRIRSGGDVKIPDSGKFVCGAGDDLQLFHDGSNSFIDDAGTGNLVIRASTLAFEAQPGNGTSRGRIDADGLKFNADSAAANALNDYEEGSWTPAYSPASGSFTAFTNSGKYTKIGNIVTCTGCLSNNGSSSPSGTVKISGLPFTVQAIGGSWDNEGGHGSLWGGYGYPDDQNNIACIKNTTTALVYDDDGNNLQASELNTSYNGGQSSFTFTYTTSA